MGRESCIFMCIHVHSYISMHIHVYSRLRKLFFAGLPTICGCKFGEGPFFHFPVNKFLSHLAIILTIAQPRPCLILWGNHTEPHLLLPVETSSHTPPARVGLKFKGYSAKALCWSGHARRVMFYVHPHINVCTTRGFGKDRSVRFTGLTRALHHLFDILKLGEDRNTLPSLQSLTALTIHKQVIDSGRDLDQVVLDLEKTYLPREIARDLSIQYCNIQHSQPTSDPYPVSYFCNTKNLLGEALRGSS
jgi:hypothetical protein